jgi:hypothetical protein
MPPEMTKPVNAHVWGTLLLLVMCATVVLASAYFSVFPKETAGVRILVRDSTGARAVYHLSLPAGTKTEETGVDAESISTVPSRIFRLADGSIVTLNDTGVVTRQGNSKGPLSVLISSTERPTLKTPFAVWGDAEKIAWVNPADNSLQVFERTARGTYNPVFLDSTIRANSIAFTEDGGTLIVAQVRATQTGESTTEFHIVDLTTLSVTSTASVTGFATIIP